MPVTFYEVPSTYATLSLAFAAIITATGGDLSSGGGQGEHAVRAQAQVYPENPDFKTGLINPTPGVDFVSLTGQTTLNGIRGTGAVIQGQPIGATLKILNLLGATVVENMELTLDGTNNGTTTGIDSTANDTSIKHSMVYDIIAGTGAVFSQGIHARGTGINIENVAVLNMTKTAGTIYGLFMRGTGTIRYVTNLRADICFRFFRGGGFNLQNCVGALSATLDYSFGTGQPTGDYNASEDGTATILAGSANSIINQHITNDLKFVNPGAGVEDPNLLEGSTLIGAGVVFGGIPLDLARVTRPTGGGNPDPAMGCLELSVAGVTGRQAIGRGIGRGIGKGMR